MGGAIAVHTAHQKLIPSLIGLAVIDVVEGTALEALNSMQSFLKGRPLSFRSLEHAIEWRSVNPRFGVRKQVSKNYFSIILECRLKSHLF